MALTLTLKIFMENQEYQDYIDEAKANKEGIAKMFGRLKRTKPKNLDTIFQELHDEAFSVIDCAKCANCCKTTSPIFRDIDIKRISKKMRMTQSDFENKYLNNDTDGDWVLKSSPCVFLGADNYCNIYDYRPQACRDYPHTDRKKVVQVLDLTLKNTEICPAVAKISMEVLKDSV